MKDTFAGMLGSLTFLAIASCAIAIVAIATHYSGTILFKAGPDGVYVGIDGSNTFFKVVLINSGSQ